MGGAYDAHFMKTLVIHVILPLLPVQEPQTLPPHPYEIQQSYWTNSNKTLLNLCIDEA